MGARIINMINICIWIGMFSHFIAYSLGLGYKITIRGHIVCEKNLCLQLQQYA
jgi:hypothetical protein